MGFRRMIRRVRLAGMIQLKPNPEREVLVLCHALEKGMGVPNPRKGFGQEKAGKLAQVLRGMADAGKADTYAFREGLAVLAAYCEARQQEGTAIPETARDTQALLEKYPVSLQGGFSTVAGEVLNKGQEMDFAAFLESRHSMRTYSQEPVTKEEILRAVYLAKRCPSACNRQPWKFYSAQNREISGAVRKAIPPQPFLEGIPYFGVITVDRTLFGEQETHQWYINGGIFLGFLSGSCIFQYQLFSKTEPELRVALKLPADEAIIAAVGFGKYPEEAKCLRAERRPDEDIAVFR